MVVILVLVIWSLSGHQITACAAPCAFRRGEPSQAQTLILPPKYIRSVSGMEHF